MLSQFERAMEQINVEIIHAYSPQAKGRIENLFGTLQDRLVKELRLENISDVATANQFLKQIFLPTYNKRFCVEPAAPADVHTKLRLAEIPKLAAVLSVQATRCINQDFTILFKNQWLQLDKVQPTLVLPGKRVTMEERLDDSIHIRLNNHYLNYTKLDHKPATSKQPIALTGSPNKQQRKTPTIPSANHHCR